MEAWSVVGAGKIHAKKHRFAVHTVLLKTQTMNYYASSPALLATVGSSPLLEESHSQHSNADLIPIYT